MSPIVVGIAGGSGSGKTTLARALYDQLGDDACCIVDQDAYYRDLEALSMAERLQVNFDAPDAFEIALLTAHIDALKAGRSIDKPQYDFARHTRASTTERIRTRPIILVEGILVLAIDAIRERLDYRVFVETSTELRFARRVHRDHSERGRDVAGICRQFTDVVQPMHDRLVEPSRKHADLIVRGNTKRDATRTLLAAGLAALARSNTPNASLSSGF